MSDVLNSMKHTYIPEVVREKALHYWDVPRLGCFMAIPLTYRSCLSEMSLDKALEEYIEILKQQEEQDKIKAEWQEEQDAEREKAVAAGEKFVPEKKVWEVLKPGPFITAEQKYCICIDTLG